MMRLNRVAGLSALTIAIAATAGCESLPLPYSGPAVVVPDQCENLTASIYFDRDSSKLMSDAAKVLRGAAAQAETCRFRTVTVYGLSDPVGSPAANLALSEKRAEVVTAELARLGFAEVTFQLMAAGETGAVTPTGEVQPLRRRADVIFSP
ncbi:MAG TPA: OmpA family protein [Caulobacteraceae bacterium]|nr:OmpA family protein [Caulobacteraceae bacterium]